MTRQVQGLIEELGRAMQAYQRSNAEFDDEVGRLLSLNPADLRCLDWLGEGRMSAGDLSTATGLSSAATTSMIDRLERKGFVRRVRSEADRRKVLVEMTEAGNEKTWQLYGPLVSDGTGLFKHFSPEELANMVDLVKAMRDLADKHREMLRGRHP